MEDSKPEVRVHLKEIHSTIEEQEAEVQKCEAKITKEYSRLEKTEVVSDEQFGELLESTNSCLFATPVCDTPSDDAPVHVPIEIQVTPTDVHVLDFMLILKISTLVQTRPNEYYEVYLLLVIYQKKVIYSKTILRTDTCKRTAA